MIIQWVGQSIFYWVSRFDYQLRAVFTLPCILLLYVWLTHRQAKICFVINGCLWLIRLMVYRSMYVNKWLFGHFPSLTVCYWWIWKRHVSKTKASDQLHCSRYSLAPHWADRWGGGIKICIQRNVAPTASSLYSPSSNCLYLVRPLFSTQRNDCKVHLLSPTPIPIGYSVAYSIRNRNDDNNVKLIRD